MKYYVFTGILILLLSCSSRKPPVPGEGYVSLSPAVTEILYLLNSGRDLKGITFYCNYPPDTVNKATVGDMINPSVEMIVSLNPQTVFTAGTPHIEISAKLKKMGFKVIDIEPGSVREVIDTIRKIAAITGDIPEGEKIIRNIEESISGIYENIRGVPTKKVYLEISAAPAMCPAKNSFLNEIIQKAGGINVASDISGDYILTGTEYIIKKDPEIIIILSENGKERKAQLEKILKDKVKASKTGKIYYLEDIDSVVRPGPRIAEGIKKIAKIIHPEKFNE